MYLLKVFQSSCNAASSHSHYCKDEKDAIVDDFDQNMIDSVDNTIANFMTGIEQDEVSDVVNSDETESESCTNVTAS